MTDPLLLSVGQAADLLGVDESTVHRWINKGIFPAPNAVRIIGGRIKISRALLVSYCNGDAEQVTTC